MVFRLDLGQINFNLVKNVLASRQLGFLATSIAFCDILTRACAEIKILGKKVTYVFRLFDFWNFFFRLSFFSFSFLFAAVINLLLGLLAVKKLPESVIETGNFYYGAARCSGSKCWSEFFAPLFEHFCAYFRLHWADHSGHRWKDLLLLQKLSIDDVLSLLV